MKIYPILSCVLLIFCCACQQKNTQKAALPPEESFLPMQIGNRWEMNPQSYTEIQDTLRIDKQLYYKFYALIGGDATDTKYLRIDDQNQLIEAYPDQPGKTYLHAKFDAKVNDVFYTLNDKSENDYKVTLIEKTDDKRVFEFDMVNHPNLKGSTHKVTYIKGKGIDDKWNSIKINGKVIK